LEQMMARVRSVEDREHAIVADAGRALRVPVGVLRGEIRHLSTLTDLDEIRRSLRLASAETERLGTLVSDLSVLSAERAGDLGLDPEPVNLREAVVRAARPLHTALGVRVTVGGDDVTVHGDRLRLEQTITYLVANSAAAGANSVQVTVHDHGDVAALDVEDDGPGFPTDVLPWVFEPFSRGEGTGTTRTAGAGLGLAVVAALTRVHGGDITADNASDLGGARVSIRLPVTAASGPAGARDMTKLRALTITPARKATPSKAADDAGAGAARTPSA
jgi:signal transduction histidine kinase